MNWQDHQWAWHRTFPRSPSPPSPSARACAARVVKAAPAPYVRGDAGGGAVASFLDVFHRSRAPTAAELVAENVNTAYTCASPNADLVASSTLRLYVSTRRGESRPASLSREHPRRVDKEAFNIPPAPPGTSAYVPPHYLA